MKEAVLAFEKIMQYQMERAGPIDGVKDEDKKHLFRMLAVIAKTFGSADLEWFCAAETTLNTLFNMKSRHSHEYAKLFID